MPRMDMRFSPNHTRRPSVPHYYLDIDVEGLEDIGITAIGENDDFQPVCRSTVISYQPSIIQVGIRIDDSCVLGIDLVDFHATTSKKTYAESEGLAKRLERHWYVQELTFSHFVKHHWYRKTPVYKATDARRFVATAGIHSWFLEIGEVIPRPTSSSDLAPAEIAA